MEKKMSEWWLLKVLKRNFGNIQKELYSTYCITEGIHLAVCINFTCTPSWNSSISGSHIKFQVLTKSLIPEMGVVIRTYHGFIITTGQKGWRYLYWNSSWNFWWWWSDKQSERTDSGNHWPKLISNQQHGRYMYMALGFYIYLTSWLWARDFYEVIVVDLASGFINHYLIEIESD